MLESVASASDQFVARPGREADGFKAEGFSRQRVFMSMNHMTRDARHRTAGETVDWLPHTEETRFLTVIMT